MYKIHPNYNVGDSSNLQCPYIETINISFENHSDLVTSFQTSVGKTQMQNAVSKLKYWVCENTVVQIIANSTKNCRI